MGDIPYINAPAPTLECRLQGVTMIGYASMTANDNAERIQRFASLGEFAAGVANDLRALLAPIDQHALALHAEAYGNGTAQARLQKILDTVRPASAVCWRSARWCARHCR